MSCSSYVEDEYMTICMSDIISITLISISLFPILLSLLSRHFTARKSSPKFKEMPVSVSAAASTAQRHSIQTEDARLLPPLSVPQKTPKLRLLLVSQCLLTISSIVVLLLLLLLPLTSNEEEEEEEEDNESWNVVVLASLVTASNALSSIFILLFSADGDDNISQFLLSLNYGLLFSSLLLRSVSTLVLYQINAERLSLFDISVVVHMFLLMPLIYLHILVRNEDLSASSSSNAAARSSASYGSFAGDESEEEEDQDEKSHEKRVQIYKESYKSGEFSDNVTVGRLLKLAKPEYQMIAGATVMLFLAGITQLALPGLLGMFVDSLEDDDGDGDGAAADDADFNAVIVTLVILALLQMIFSLFRVYWFSYAGEKLVARLRNRLFSHVVRMEIGWFDQQSTGELIDRFTADVTLIQSSVTTNVSFLLRYVLQIIGGIFILFLISWDLTLVMLCVVPVVAIGTMKYGKFVRAMSKERQDALALATSVAQESFGNIRVVRSFANEKKEEKRYAKQIENVLVIAKRMSMAFALFIGSAMFIANVTLCLILWYGGRKVIDGEMTAGELTSFLLYTMFIAFALGGISSLFSEFMRAVGASHRVFELLDRINDMYNHTGGKGIRPTQACRGHIEFRNVQFEYPSRKDTSVLKNVTLELLPNTSVALVGPSGQGKSTICALIQRFYDPTAGEIYLDGMLLSTLDTNWIRENTAIVSQEPVLFATTIRDNILFGVSEEQQKIITDDEIHEACKKANCHDFIMSFPDKYETLVGERGVKLSGGQKQRVAIARALLRNPVILLLDEATSALDTESEHIVQQALEKLMVGRTTLTIAHRLSTVINANRIYVIEHGNVVESGTHQSLLANEGAYKNLIKRQMQDSTSY